MLPPLLPLLSSLVADGLRPRGPPMGRLQSCVRSSSKVGQAAHGLRAAQVLGPGGDAESESAVPGMGARWSGQGAVVAASPLMASARPSWRRLLGSREVVEACRLG